MKLSSVAKQGSSPKGSLSESLEPLQSSMAINIAGTVNLCASDSRKPRAKKDCGGSSIPHASQADRFSASHHYEPMRTDHRLAMSIRGDGEIEIILELCVNLTKSSRSRLHCHDTTSCAPSQWEFATCELCFDSRGVGVPIACRAPVRLARKAPSA